MVIYLFEKIAFLKYLCFLKINLVAWEALVELGLKRTADQIVASGSMVAASDSLFADGETWKEGTLERGVDDRLTVLLPLSPRRVTPPAPRS